MAFSSIFNLWNKLNIRGIVILSLSLQVFLILCAPLRKKMGNPHIIFLLWLAYLMADWVAAYAIGLISHSQGNSSVRATEVDGALQAFWASFLLLHLGGPDTITAFSLEDSSLWQRHMLNLISQVSVAIYVFVQIFPNDKSLAIPTILVFLAGVIKNVERTLALNLSSLSRLRESMLEPTKMRLETYPELFRELEVLERGYSNDEEAKLAESIVVKHAYYFFRTSKFLLADLYCFTGERFISRKYFRKVSAMDAFRVISVELNFMYEMLHTKALAMRFKWSYILRFIAFTEIATASVLFTRFKKHQLPEQDVKITYILLFGGIALDVIALFLLFFSDWTVAGISYNTRSSKLDSFLHKLVSITDNLRKPRFATCKVEPNTNSMYAVLDTPFIFQRWSESISACNLFSEFRKESPRKMYRHDQRRCIITFSNIWSLPFLMVKKIISCFHRTRKIVIKRESSIFETKPRHLSKNLSKNPFINKLWIFIFEEMRRKSKDTHNPIKTKDIFDARGDLFLRGRPEGIDCSNLLEHITKATYDGSVIIWHIATEIWYNREKPTERNDEREFSKILSDYLLYLLVNQPKVMSVVAGFAQRTLIDILSELEDFIKNAKDVQGLSNTLYEELPIEKMDSVSTLYQGIVLARKMESFGERKWKVMSRVWVEMLSYAAGHIKGEAHVQVLSKGGELLAFIWLLMAHFGCAYNPEWGTYQQNVFGMHSETALSDEEEDGSTVKTQLV